MGKPSEIIRDESSAAELRALAASTRYGRVVRRLLTRALVLEGESRDEAAQLNGMDRQTLRDWVHRYNAEGVAGLYPRAIPGSFRTATVAKSFSTSTLIIPWRANGLRSVSER